MLHDAQTVDSRLLSAEGAYSFPEPVSPSASSSPRRHHIPAELFRYRILKRVLDSTKQQENCVSVSDEKELSRVAVVIPTCNAAQYWEALRAALDNQGISAEQILIVDSSSSDGTRALAQSAGYNVMRVERGEFDHGGTRRLASESLPWADALIYLTQDAVPASNAFRTLHQAFSNPRVGTAYGRQLPRAGACPIERHARLFNYPSVSAIHTYSSREQLGIKAAFTSDSFAAYRCSALREVGGFPKKSIVGEESIVACRLLIAGWEIAYVADATVVHSHAFGLRKEFARYFDIGVHHARESWILEHFGKADEEGKRFLRSEFSYLLAEDARLIPVALLRTLLKLFAYQIGRREGYVPLAIKTRLSGQRTFWSQARPAMQLPNEPDTPTVRSPVSAIGGNPIQSRNFGAIRSSH